MCRPRQSIPPDLAVVGYRLTVEARKEFVMRKQFTPSNDNLRPLAIVTGASSGIGTVSAERFMILTMRWRSFKPQKNAERLRGVGNSSGDENGSSSVKCWEIIADRLHAGAGLTASPSTSPSTDFFFASMCTATEDDSSLRPVICSQHFFRWREMQ
jgi:hypothetical protein